ncbi:MAG TPA: threonine synthase [Gemmatimonadaceae bacterium]|nr:threonine synthase [Gemmatimonadaceae bacterium]
MNASVQVCDACGARFDALDARVQCASCDGLLHLEHPQPPTCAAALRDFFDARLTPTRASGGTGVGESGVWRFRELVMPGVSDAEVVTQGEGNTPLLARPRVARFAGVNHLLLKHEGHNPTGSFKDRGMTVAVTQAKRIGARAVACASTGNTSAALASYAALAGLRGLVLVPAGKVALGKLSQTIAYGAQTLLVRGDFDDCLRLARESSEQLGVYLANSINPWRLEGQKSIIFDLLQQLRWSSPDWLVLPAGNLGNTAAFGAALRAALRLGLIDRAPRLACVQAAGSAPFAASFAADFSSRHTVRAETIATAIRIGDPASYDRAVRAIRETDGVVLAVSDDEILEAKAVIDASGVGCEPASAASVAGTRALVQRGVIRAGDRVVALLTGHMLKDPEVMLAYHRDTEPAPAHANRSIEIDATLADMERVLRTAPAA